ncbi:glycoside hydrolase family 20 protein [Durotheca rogersii]|uniref:glycoside hydrolase family 20 protein n=1 Tax=Durotheca rogersii TaxID=419775 RepID=UPI00221F7CA8|nr:glycoside hydrolase family 20 protein [Durotheca rogersii]KAI5864562.1 glycoside hydrolase family 20 protein [Durotheca rogersii]
MRPLSTSVFLIALSNGLSAFAASRFAGIPVAPFTPSNGGTYKISSLRALVVDSKFAQSRDETGETLIPPTLREFAETFADDLRGTLAADIDVSDAEKPPWDTIFLTLGDASKYTDAAGAQTSEGYTLSVDSSGIVISGASPLGVWWGTRTVLQQAILFNGSVPYGVGDDAPGWKTRGMMLDVARHFYPPEFVIELCSYMSFFKQNTFQIHLSDNLYNNVGLYSREESLQLYARFRLWSDSPDVAGLNKYKNESYTREQYEEMETACASRGVTVIPEIEAPGHALVIVQWKPELALSNDIALLNISHPDTIPTVKTIWSTFLDWFHSKTVHIGADEYRGDVSDYNRFVNEMADYIYRESGKAIRIWGTFPPKPEYDNISRNVSIQHWAFFEDNPYHDYILNNYTVLNSDDAYYVVNKWSRSYPPVLPFGCTFGGNPATGGAWQPHVFDLKNASNNAERANPLVRGAVTPLWNDYGANATVFSEAYYAWREGIPALADKQWGGDLAAAEFASSFAALHPFVPGQNLDRAIPSAGPTIFNYTAGSVAAAAAAAHRGTPALARTDVVTVEDLSGNGYDASTDCPLADDEEDGGAPALRVGEACALDTPLASKGRDYTLTLRLRVDAAAAPGADATLLQGADSALLLTPGLTLFASGSHYRLNLTLPLGAWVDVSVAGRGNQTFGRVRPAALGEPLPRPGSPPAAGEREEEFLATLGVNGEFLVWAPVAIEAPIRRLGGPGAAWEGRLAAMSLSSVA